MFALRLDDLRWSTGANEPEADAARTIVGDRVAITVFRRADGETAESLHQVAATGAWRLLVQARRGSLEAVVERSRLRNLAVSVGVLAVLGASLGLILITSAREQRVARQQLEFVASVTHELRTPLAVIRSAGENLADGVVSGAQVATYGAVIRNEGRRLSDMVERVMDFAGMTAGTLIRTRVATDVRALVDRAVAAVRADAADRGVSVQVHKAQGVFAITGDPDALLSALQNALANAVKYSHDGGVVDIDLVASPHVVRIAVSDRGIGIDARDLPHVFQPFFRGQRAVAAQIRGSGIGLSVVQRVVEAHGGEVRIAPRPGGGTVLTIELPAESHAGSPA